MSEPGQAALGRLIHFTPLRYPGGKAKLATYVKALLKENRLVDGEYVEPYAGGAAIALELLFHEYVSRIHINDVSKLVYAFWKSVLTETEPLCRLILKTPLTVSEWDKQKAIIENPKGHDTLEIGFATFFLNRTNRSGILNGGIIGGRDQTGPWKIDARYNAKELVRRVEEIAAMRDRIKLTKQDALKFLTAGIAKWPEQTLIYLDPPYYVKGRDLYYDFYQPEDHAHIASFMNASVKRQQWIVSYDNVKPIRDLYPKSRNIVYSIGYSARSVGKGSEVMFFDDMLKIPPLIGPIQMTEDHAGILKRLA
jgi:DNA adenine methylase